MGFVIKTDDHELQVLQQSQSKLLKMNTTPKVFRAHQQKLKALECKTAGKTHLQELQAMNTHTDACEMQRQKQDFKFVLKAHSENNNKKTLTSVPKKDFSCFRHKKPHPG